MKWNTRYLMPGMQLANDLYSNGLNASYLLPKDKILTDADIERLIRIGIEDVEVYPYEETFFPVFREYVLSSMNNNSVVKVKKISEIYAYIASKTTFFKFDMTRYLKEDLSSKNHSINVANMAVALASMYNKTVGQNEKIPIENMAEVSLLADVGRLAKDEKIRKVLKNKYGYLIDIFKQKYHNIPDDIFKQYRSNYHSFYSYLILKGSNLDNVSLTSILLHHEKESGNNGPLGVEMSKVDQNLLSVKMSKILKICDMYDILLYRAKEEKPEQPFKDIHKSLEKFVSSGLTDPYWTKLLSLIIPVYPLGEKVELSDGTIGVVSQINEFDMTNPLINDLNGNKIDLIKENLAIMSLYIEEMEKRKGVLY